MARNLIPKYVWRLHEMTGKLSGSSRCKERIFVRHFSLESNDLESKYRPAKLAYDLIVPKSRFNDRLPPLLFLHGMGSARDVAWLDVPQRISDKTKRKAYNLDARNHGDSEWSDVIDFDLNAVDLLNFMDEMGLPKVVTIGHSMGGITSIKVALKEPERFEMVFVEDKFVKKVPQYYFDKVLIFMSLWREAEKFIPPEFTKEEADHFVTEYVRQKTRPGMHPPSDYRDRVHYPLKKDSSGRYYFTPNLEVVLEAMKHSEELMSENEGIYDGPSYFLYGTKSPYKVYEEKDHILKHFPKAVFIPFETPKHCLHRELPDLFVDVVAKCINENVKNRDRTVASNA